MPITTIGSVFSVYQTQYGGLEELKGLLEVSYPCSITFLVERGRQDIVALIPWKSSCATRIWPWRRDRSSHNEFAPRFIVFDDDSSTGILWNDHGDEAHHRPSFIVLVRAENRFWNAPYRAFKWLSFTNRTRLYIADGISIYMPNHGTLWCGGNVD